MTYLCAVITSLRQDNQFSMRTERYSWFFILHPYLVLPYVNTINQNELSQLGELLCKRKRHLFYKTNLILMLNI